MRIPSAENHSSRGRASDAGSKEIDELDSVLERMNVAGFLRLLDWARRQAPDLLKKLMISFLTGDASQSNVKKAEGQHGRRNDSPSDASGFRGTMTLSQLEREHIARVLSESRTLEEAASKLGIRSSTLWRKRKRYGLG
jgi:transcriptional regulator with PAS, ATPase and Fis domain